MQEFRLNHAIHLPERRIQHDLVGVEPDLGRSRLGVLHCSHWRRRWRSGGAAVPGGCPALVVAQLPGAPVAADQQPIVVIPGLVVVGIDKTQL